MQKLNIPTGSAILIGAPAKPMDIALSVAIGKLTDSIEGIFEAHLPQIFAVDVMEESAQVLVVVLRQGADLKLVTEQLGSGLSEILPEGMHLDVWPIPVGDTMVDDVRRTGCLI
jgi:hypothetical protein